MYTFNPVTGRKEPAKEIDQSYFKENFQIEDFSNINVIPTASSIPGSGFSDVNYKVIGPEGGCIKKAHRARLSIEPGALRENVLVCMMTKVENRLQKPNNTPVSEVAIFTEPSKYPVQNKALIQTNWVGEEWELKPWCELSDSKSTISEDSMGCYQCEFVREYL